ncbi:MAG: 30S ribosomal protein S7 [Candidatus Roizmanbacteria bacterium GW2011_GWA2_35_19]|uniref:Small ribosomal subunit protein uS7 n=2 Tax=Candidatus Roizmaniibacteriota TaxID=1752723 RepID=A0A0G0BTS4_9BACT|nr:MAG: 30S ribosomal protein S7 [Candidatus Roizmanbacteria bacterium GW2011_GWC2_35_12]KKP72869.1 MAG: 30S ribosomal protein S7 [Candidatus Roizmanbacteria bacterium GW2011_GWA2_35_19]
MPRHAYKKTKVKGDKIYGSLEVSKFINYVMVDGKKAVAEKLLYQVFEDLKKQGADPLKILHQAIENVAPLHEVKPRRLGGASYLVPIEVRRDRKIYLASNWIINAAKTRSNKEFHTFSAKLLAEILDASKNQGTAVTKKIQTEKLAETNKAFSHLKW